MPEESDATKALKARISELGRADMAVAYTETQKLLRQDKVGAVKKAVVAALEAEGADVASAKGLMKALEADVVRNNILDTGIRIDGRDTKTVRPIMAEVGVLPRAHGSALFTRGETQALCVATLGTGQDEQIIDALAGEYREDFMLHYNFPPYSVNETGRMGSPGRREVGHGKLAWRAIHPLLPEKEKFPYTIRVVSEITESNGSSSMATVCGTSLSMMDAGVPLKRPVRGHRHGPDQGRPRLRRAVRHPGRRGPPRRHGLQGGRHGGGHHQPADGHQDHVHHLRDHEDRAGPGQGRPPAHPGRDGRRACRATVRTWRRPRRASP